MDISQFNGNQILCSEVAVDLPYPPTRVEEPNLDYAIALFRQYSGFDGELSATTQYIYQNMVLYNSDPTAAALLECIAINEARHFQILGQLIYMLGADPKLYAPTRLRGEPQRIREIRGGNDTVAEGYSWWCGDVLIYEHDFNIMIRNNLELEYIAIANYNAALRVIEDIYVRPMLERIILDEERHIVIFNELLNQGQPEG
jgi:bacterioferritin